MNKEKLARKILSPSLAGIIKNVVAYPRYLQQLGKCKSGYKAYGNKYSQHVLFVAGLPKSGTTWLEKMLYTLPGFHEVMIPEAVYYEQKNRGSHDFDFPSNTISRLNKSLAVLKLHVHGSSHNVSILNQAQINYVVIFRDLRDVAVSYYFYVRNTPWHPEYASYSGYETVQEGLHDFGINILPDYQKWVDSWKNNGGKNCLIIRYEDLRYRTEEVFKQVMHHYGIELTTEQMELIIEQNSFSSLSRGRKEGEDNDSSFFRKGISGDWKNHFTDDLKELYKSKIGEFLIENGYESDLNW